MVMSDIQTLKMALVGFQIEHQKVQERIAEIERRLGGRTPRVAASSSGPKPQRKMSAAARKRIADAQKKRWAAFHKAQKPAKKKLSAARKAALVANLAKARAAKTAKKGAAA
jgi:cell division septum initiation protein DivIVA